MGTASVTRQDANTLRLAGELTFRNILDVRRQVEVELSVASGDQTLNLAEVTLADSSALSLWLCLQRQAQSQRIRLHAVDIPEDIRSLGRLVGMDRSWIEVPAEIQCSGG